MNQLFKKCTGLAALAFVSFGMFGHAAIDAPKKARVQFGNRVQEQQAAKFKQRAVAHKKKHDKHSSSSSCSCSDLPQPRGGEDFNVNLEGQNCNCCNLNDEHALVKRDPYSNHYCMNQKKLCKYLDNPTEYLTIQDPSKLVLVPNPPIGPVEPGQQITRPPEVPYEDQISLRGKNVLIIGGSTGNGKAVAERFHSEGANVIATSRHPECYEKPCYKLWKLEVHNEKEVKKFIKKVAKHFRGKIDILVNAAYIYSDGALSDYTGDEYINGMDAGLISYQRATHYALPYMRHSDETRVISFGSLNAYANFFATGTVYSIMKRALQSWNNQLQVDEMYKKAFGLIEYGPTFVLVEPTTFPNKGGVYEGYKPGDVELDDLTMSNVIYLTAALNPGLAPANTPEELKEIMGEQIFRIAVAPQPTIRYMIASDSEYAQFVPLLQALNTLPITDAFNVQNDFTKNLLWDSPATIDAGRELQIERSCP